jgi:sugar phosphate isomerase/epimerase
MADIRTTVSSYSFEQAMRDGRIQRLVDLPAIAQSLGFEGLEIATSIDQPQAKELRKAADDAGIALSSCCVGADFLQNEVQEQVEKLKPIVDTTAILGASLLRHDATFGFPKDYCGIRTFGAVLSRLAEGCRKVTEYAASAGVRTMVENHGQFCQDSDRVEKLINEVAHPNFGALVDMGNFLCVDENPAHAVSILAPLAFHVHAKDFLIKQAVHSPGVGWFRTRGANWLRGTIIGHGVVPIEQCLGILQQAGYQGWLSVEFEGVEDCILGIKDGKQNLDRMLSELYR